MDNDVDLDQLARGTPGFSGAELFNLINQAALKASIEGLNMVNMHALEYAKDKLMMGAERRSAVISPETMKMTAFHEAGHALVALKTLGADPVHKATIMPRGRALGMVMQLPEGDQTSMSRQQMLARLDVCMGGRVAEELVYGKGGVTSGASSDIMQASRLARAMVTKYGLSEKVGIVFFDDKASYSSMSQNEIDGEVKELLSAAYERAKAVLVKHRAELDIIANALMEYESVSGGEIVDLIEGRSIGGTGAGASKKRSQKPSRPIQTIVLKDRGIKEGAKEGEVVGTSTVVREHKEATKEAAASKDQKQEVSMKGDAKVSENLLKHKNTTIPATPATISAGPLPSPSADSKPPSSRGPPKA